MKEKKGLREMKTKINVDKDYPAKKIPNRLRVGLGWDPATDKSGVTYDLDLFAFMLGEDGKLLGEEYFIYYKNKNPFSGAIVHSGDDVDGSRTNGDDDEFVDVNLAKIPSEVQEIVFVVLINKALQRRQTFEKIANPFVRVCDVSAQRNAGSQSREGLVYRALSVAFPNADNYEFARMMRKGGSWYLQLIENELPAAREDGIDAYIEKFSGEGIGEASLSVTVDFKEPSIKVNQKKTRLSAQEAVLLYYYWGFGKTYPDSLYQAIAAYRARLVHAVEKSVRHADFADWLDKLVSSSKFNDPQFHHPDIDSTDVAHVLSTLRKKLTKVCLAVDEWMPKHGRLFHFASTPKFVNKECLGKRYIDPLPPEFACG